MRLRELPGWMPLWYLDDLKAVQGEVGILTGVNRRIGGKVLGMTIHHEGMEYNGWLAAEPSVTEEIFPIVKSLIGRPMTEVADLEIDTQKPPPVDPASKTARTKSNGEGGECG